MTPRGVLIDEYLNPLLKELIARLINPFINEQQWSAASQLADWMSQLCKCWLLNKMNQLCLGWCSEWLSDDKSHEGMDWQTDGLICRHHDCWMNLWVHWTQEVSKEHVSIKLKSVKLAAKQSQTAMNLNEGNINTWQRWNERMTLKLMEKWDEWRQEGKLRQDAMARKSHLNKFLNLIKGNLIQWIADELNAITKWSSNHFDKKTMRKTL